MGVGVGLSTLRTIGFVRLIVVLEDGDNIRLDSRFDLRTLDFRDAVARRKCHSLGTPATIKQI